MKSTAQETAHLRDALASLPEPVDLHDLMAPRDRWREQDDFLEEALEETFPASDPISPSRVR